MLRNELHESVLMTEVIKVLSIKPDGVYIDATLVEVDTRNQF